MSLDTLETFPNDVERASLGRLGRDSLVYALGGLAYKGVALVTIPILARLLTPGQLGILDLAAVLASTVGLVAVMGSDQAVAFHESREAYPGRVWGAAIATVLVSGLLLAAVGTAFREPLATFMTGDSSNGPVIAAAAIYGLALAFSATALNAIRLRGSPKAYAITSFLMVSAEMGVALTIALLLPGAVALMVVGWAAGAAAVFSPALVCFLPRLRMPHAPDIRRIVSFGGPLVPAAVAWLVGDAWIRGTIARDVELSVLGEYGIAYRIASVLGLVVTGFGVAWYPFLYRSAGTAVPTRAAGALSLVLLVFGAVGMVLTTLSPEIIAIMAGEGYADARFAIAPLAGGMVALGGFVLVAAVVGTSGSTRRVALAAVVGAMVQVALAGVLVPAAGLLGASLASLAGYVVAALILVGSEPRVVSGRSGIATAAAVMLAGLGLFCASLVTGSPLVVRVATLGIYAALTIIMAIGIRGRGGWSDLSLT